VKHLEGVDAASLKVSADEMGVALTSRQAELLVLHLEALLDANTRLNLTSIVDPRTAARLHTLDSLAATREVEQAPSGRILDIGTGGGVPGLPLIISTNRRGLLIDSVGKKVAAVAGIVAELGLEDSVEVSSVRAEDLAVREREAFAVVVARAVAPLASLLELAAPLLMTNGLLIALKGTPDSEEMDAAGRAGRVVGMKLQSARGLTLPGGYERRTILAYRKSEQSTIRLPRRVGMAQNSPLG
jgi:16S rRNA (guanine527-N7)-methyltransferase